MPSPKKILSRKNPLPKNHNDRFMGNTDGAYGQNSTIHPENNVHRYIKQSNKNWLQAIELCP